ncbi:MAG: hypothetical protein HRT58_00280 [Crocinitomicaceae bacterium]|nr:hypothetical protein [Flavobacteriales bacterium]NQZ34057.1 hypothetical protein [Crocinitomicaceae bacterium]
MHNLQHEFYLLSEIFISLIGALLLLAIWSAVQRYFKNQLSHEISIKRVDKGLIYLSLSLFVWCSSATVTFITSTTSGSEWMILISQNVFSILNSLFLILALFYLDHAPSYLYNNEKNAKKIIYFLIGLSILSYALAIIFNDKTSTYGVRYSVIPDLLLSLLLSWLLAVSLFRTFVHRKMKLVSIGSLIVISLIFISQLPQAFHIESLSFYNDLIKIVAKTGLISIFLVLGASWVIELAQTPNVVTMKIHFTDWNQVTISIPSKGIENRQIEFGSKTTQFNNLLKFAIRRKCAQEKDMCIEVFAGGEIPSQTYLSRIIDNINDILDLKDDDKLNRNDLFTFIGQAKYRLRFIPKFIEIDAALLNEFIHNVDNQEYVNFTSESSK